MAHGRRSQNHRRHACLDSGSRRSPRRAGRAVAVSHTCGGVIVGLHSRKVEATDSFGQEVLAAHDRQRFEDATANVVPVSLTRTAVDGLAALPEELWQATSASRKVRAVSDDVIENEVIRDEFVVDETVADHGEIYGDAPVHSSQAADWSQLLDRETTIAACVAKSASEYSQESENPAAAAARAFLARVQLTRQHKAAQGGACALGLAGLRQTSAEIACEVQAVGQGQPRVVCVEEGKPVLPPSKLAVVAGAAYDRQEREEEVMSAHLADASDTLLTPTRDDIVAVLVAKSATAYAQESEIAAAAAARAFLSRLTHTRHQNGSHESSCACDLGGLCRTTAAGLCEVQPVRRSRVRFNLAANTIQEIQPYSEVYGLHPREFVFAKDSSFMPAAGPFGFVALADECVEGSTSDEDEWA